MMNILEKIDADLIEPQRLAACVLDQTTIERRHRPNDDWLLSSREALQAARFEMQLASVAAQNVAYGVTLHDDDRARLLLASARLEALAAEAGL